MVSPPRPNLLLVPTRQLSCGDCYGIVIHLYDTLGLFGIVADLERQTGGAANKVAGTVGLYSGRKRIKGGLVSPDMIYRDVGSNYYVIHKELLWVRETLGWFVRSLMGLALVAITCLGLVVIKHGVIEGWI